MKSYLDKIKKEDMSSRKRRRQVQGQHSWQRMAKRVLANIDKMCEVALN